MHNFLPTREAEIKFFFTLTVALSLLGIVSFVAGSRVERSDISVPTQVVHSVFPEVFIEAKSAYIYDARTEAVLFAKDENERLPLASITKLMAAVVAEEASPIKGMVKIKPEALTAEGDSGLSPGEVWALRDLIDFSLVSSSNDGMRAVALSLGALGRSNASDAEILKEFVIAMNEKASELDLKNTYFWNETGLDESDVKGGAYGSAKDISTLLYYIVSQYPELMAATRESETEAQSLDNVVHLAKNTNHLAAAIPGLLASKTGFTDISGGNLAFAFDPELGRPIIVVILGSSSEGRFRDAAKLISATMKYINN